MHKIPVVFILYKPCYSFYKRLTKLSELYNIHIYCNCADSLSKLRSYNHLNNIIIFGNGNNIGISEACISICNYLKNHHRYFLLFDQDTVLSENNLVIFNDSELNDFASYSIVQLKSNVNNTCNLKHKFGLSDVNFVINSGSVININKALKFKLYNKFFNVDCSDYYYCLKSSIHGLQVGFYNKSFDLDHSSEQPDKIISVLGLHFYVRRYNTKRLYFFNSRIIILILISLLYLKLSHLHFLMRSFLIYNIKQILVRLPTYAS